MECQGNRFCQSYSPSALTCTLETNSGRRLRPTHKSRLFADVPTPQPFSRMASPPAFDDRLQVALLASTVCLPDASANGKCPPPSSADLNPRTCPVCFCDLEPSILESFCGVHACCADCAAGSARAQVRAGEMPRCFNVACRKEMDPLVARRLLKPEDYKLYLRATVWSNPCVEVCPKCRCLLYADEHAQSCEDSSTCPRCEHDFCRDCRCGAHPGVSCEDAVQQRASVENALPGCEAHEIRLVRHAAVELESLARENGWKVCPRCQAFTEKADADSCDHMTCAQCRHEFCWSCLADRGVIYAHGNHHHFPSCKFYAPYQGPDHYLADRCARCSIRGKVCRPPARKAASKTRGTAISSMLDTFATLVGGSLLSSSCSLTPR